RYSGRAASPCTCGVRLSRTRTPYPWASRLSARCEPMKPAPPVIRTSSGVGLGDFAQLTEPGLRAQRVRLVRPLPREVAVVAAEVAVRGGLHVDRAAQVEIAQDRGGTQV